MKWWKIASLSLLIVALIAVGYGVALVRQGFGTHGSPSTPTEINIPLRGYGGSKTLWQDLQGSVR